MGAAASAGAPGRAAARSSVPLETTALPALRRRDAQRLVASWERDLALLERFEAYCQERERGEA